MSIETATQRLTAALASLEGKVAQRLEGLQAEHVRLKRDYDALQAEANQLRSALQIAEARASDSMSASDGMSATRFADLEKRNATYQSVLTSTLRNLDTLIARVESAAK